MRKRPLIGVTTQTLHAIEGIPEALPSSWVMNQRYVHAVMAAGGVPVLVPLLAEDPADWDVNKVAKLWEDYLVKYPAGQIQAGMFHNDDMALAAAKVIKNAGRDKEIALCGVDAMPPAIQAVIDGSLAATVRNPSCRIHWGAVVLGALAATGVKDLPKYVLTDGPVVTQKIGPGLLFMEEQGLA